MVPAPEDLLAAENARLRAQVADLLSELASYRPSQIQPPEPAGDKIVPDAAGRRPPQDPLVASQERLRIALQAAELGTWDFDLENGVVTACGRVCAMFGCDRSLERPEDWIARLHPDDRERVSAAFQRASAASSKYEDEYRVLHNDGSITWVLAEAVPVADSQGRATRLTGVAKDITARKQMEEALRASEADAQRRLGEIEAICEFAPVGLCVLDTNLRFVRVNRRFAEMNGWPPEAHAGKTPRELNPDLGDIAEGLLRRVLESSEPQLNIEVRGTTVAQPGVQRIWNEHWVPLKGPSGEITGISIAVEEITEAKRIEEALRESEERFRTMADGCPAIIWVSDAEGGNRFINRAYREFFGVAPEQVEGYKWRPLIHPDDEPEYVGAVLRAVRERAPIRVEARVRRADGEWRWISSYGEPRFSASGEFIGHAGISPDITERKQAEQALAEAVQRLNAHMDNSPLAVIEVDPQFRVTRWSKEAERVFGWSAEEILGRAIGEMRWVHEDDVEGVRRVCQDMLDGTRPRNLHVNRNYCKDGSMVECEWYNSAIYDQHGRPTSILSQVLDVTDRKRTEERLRQAQKTESIALLAGGVAHDFNNLLVGVMGNASVAREMLPDADPVREMLGRILKASKQAADLTRQMLAYSGKGRFFSEPVNISELVRESSALVGSSISKKICIRPELEPDLPAVEADRSQIHQIFSNLMLNAAEAIGEGPGAICVTTGVRQLSEAYIRDHLEGAGVAPGRYVCLTVHDTGCGMDERTRTRVFDPFFTTKFTGRGLGLAAVAGIVRGHKGAIQVESAVGKGSTFRVWLPALEQAAVPKERPVERSREELRGCGTILVVDDEEPVRNVAKRSLQRYGYEVLTADSGPAAIELFRSESRRIRLVILDLTMPGIGGRDALPALRRIKPDIGVVVSSGYPEAETMRLFADTGVAGFIQKPYTMQQLARKVKSVLA